MLLRLVDPPDRSDAGLGVVPVVVVPLLPVDELDWLVAGAPAVLGAGVVPVGAALVLLILLDL